MGFGLADAIDFGQDFGQLARGPGSERSILHAKSGPMAKQRTILIG